LALSHIYEFMLLLLPLRVIPRKSSQPFHCYLKTFHQQSRGMKAYIQIVGQNSPEGPPSLIVHYDSQRYLFNCREGTQRLCVQEKARLNKLSNVFLTRVNWDCMGGLTGTLLNLRHFFSLLMLYIIRYAFNFDRCRCS
jgi:hypothetical protein